MFPAGGVGIGDRGDLYVWDGGEDAQVREPDDSAAAEDTDSKQGQDGTGGAPRWDESAGVLSGDGRSGTVVTGGRVRRRPGGAEILTDQDLGVGNLAGGAAKPVHALAHIPDDGLELGVRIPPVVQEFLVCLHGLLLVPFCFE